MRSYGLIGLKLSHSFSEQYFNEKFLKEGISDSEYLNFEIDDISTIRELINEKQISGLNITIPYKETIIPLLDILSDDAKSIGAVNTVQIINNKLIGHNTDIIGFEKSIKPLLKDRKRALILGNGGGAKAVQFILEKLNIEHKTVSRNTSFDYSDITTQIIRLNDIIINTTPLGMYPNLNNYPKIPYDLLNKKHLLFDLVYNPSSTLFLRYGKKHNCKVKNGLEMFQIQAEASWDIWTL